MRSALSIALFFALSLPCSAQIVTPDSIISIDLMNQWTLTDEQLLIHAGDTVEYHSQTKRFTRVAHVPKRMEQMVMKPPMSPYYLAKPAYMDYSDPVKQRQMEHERDSVYRSIDSLNAQNEREHKAMVAEVEAYNQQIQRKNALIDEAERILHEDFRHFFNTHTYCWAAEIQLTVVSENWVTINVFFSTGSPGDRMNHAFYIEHCSMAVAKEFMKVFYTIKTFD